VKGNWIDKVRWNWVPTSDHLAFSLVIGACLWNHQAISCYLKFATYNLHSCYQQKYGDLHFYVRAAQPENCNYNVKTKQPLKMVKSVESLILSVQAKI
jgi:hypothetical protein